MINDIQSRNNDRVAAIFHDLGRLCVRCERDTVYEWHQDGVWAQVIYPTRGSARKALARRCRIDHAFDLTHGFTRDQAETLKEIAPDINIHYATSDKYHVIIKGMYLRNGAKIEKPVFAAELKNLQDQYPTMIIAGLKDIMA